MLRTSTRRGLAVLGAGALLVTIPTTASAEISSELVNPALVGGSLQNAAGGSLAAAGSGGLGTASTGGHCAVLDPTLGSVGNAMEVDVTSKEGAPGVAEFVFWPNTYLGSGTATVRWTNTTTGGSGTQDLGPAGGPYVPVTADVATGAGHVAWTVEGRQTGVPLPLTLLAVPGTSAEGLRSATLTLPATPCSGAADIA